MKKFLAVENERVTLIHTMPFDPVNGMGKTEGELLQMGILLDEIPEPEVMPGKMPLPYYTEAQGFHYRYEDTPPEPASSADLNALWAQIDYIGMMTETI